MITLYGTECGAFISSSISPFYPWSHSMGPSVVPSLSHYFTILPMITLNGTKWGAFISLRISPFCPWSHSMGPSVVHSFLHVFHHFIHDHTQWDRVWCIHSFAYFNILPMITLKGTECGAFISSRIHHFTHDHTQWDRVWYIHFFKFFKILPMTKLNGTECGAFFSSRISPFYPWSHSMGPSVMHSFLQVFHNFTHDHTQWDRVWCIHFTMYFTILPLIILNGTECGEFIFSSIS